MPNINKRYLCKNTYYYCIEGRHYDVLKSGPFFITFCVCDDELCHEETFSYDIEHPNAYQYFPDFYKHFYTEKEERQLKLKKLDLI